MQPKVYLTSLGLVLLLWPASTSAALPKSAVQQEGSYGSSCNETVQCQPEENFICLAGRCECPTPLSQYFVEEDNRCYNRIGYFCTPGESSCDPARSTCEADPLSITGFSCQCDLSLGYSPGYERVCGRSVNQTCSDYSGNEVDPQQCADDVGLECINGICQCLNEPTGEQRWSPTQLVCGSLEGHPCTIMTDSGNLLCYDGLECQPVFGPLEGICRKPSESNKHL